MRTITTALLGVLVLPLFNGHALGQPTYKLEVKPNLRPLTVIKLEGTKLSRTPVKDDPGFRLQWHFKKDGKTLQVLEGRSRPQLEIPDKSPGLYSVAVEMFNPSYKTGDLQKGQFRPASDELVYEVKSPLQPDGTIQVELKSVKPLKASIPLGKPTLIVQCGRGGGAREKELVSNGYGYKLVQGAPHDGWTPPAAKSHGWIDGKKLQFEVTVPPGIEGVLRLHFVDGGSSNALFRSQNLTIDGKLVGSYTLFTVAGILVDAEVSATDTKDGKIEAIIDNTQPRLSAAVSTIEFLPVEKK